MHNSTNIQNAFVTGSTKRIGLIIANHLENKLGINVITHSSKHHITSGKHITCDFTKKEDIEAALEKLQDVQILVNNASLFVKDNVDNISLQNLQDHFMVGAFTPLMLSSKLKNLQNIINILDGRITKNEDYFLSYMFAKKMLAECTKIYAKILAKNKVRVNGIALGLIMHNKEKPKDLYNHLIQATPLRTETEEAELTGCIDLILNSNSMTGNIIYLDSGMHL